VSQTDEPPVTCRTPLLRYPDNGCKPWKSLQALCFVLPAANLGVSGKAPRHGAVHPLNTLEPPSVRLLHLSSEQEHHHSSRCWHMSCRCILVSSSWYLHLDFILCHQRCGRKHLCISSPVHPLLFLSPRVSLRPLAAAVWHIFFFVSLSVNQIAFQ
jgi:hypothetical protein